jgi:hypothetical protein
LAALFKKSLGDLSDREERPPLAALWVVFAIVPDREDQTAAILATLFKSAGKKNGRKAHSVVRRCFASQHRRAASSAAGASCASHATKKRPHEVACPLDLVAGAGFEPATFGL